VSVPFFVGKKNNKACFYLFSFFSTDPFPPVFKSCPTDIYGDEDLVVSWDEPSVYDNVDIYNTEVNGDSIRNQKDVPLGTYAVTYTVWDYDMNQAACSFLVRIVEQSKMINISISVVPFYIK
jgi:hypothetical protein